MHGWFRLLAVPGLELLAVLYDGAEVDPKLTALGEQLLEVRDLTYLGELVEIAIEGDLKMADAVRGSDILRDIEQLVQGHRGDKVIWAAAGLDAEEYGALALVDRLQVELVTTQHLPDRGVVESLQAGRARGHDCRHLLGGAGVGP